MQFKKLINELNNHYNAIKKETFGQEEWSKQGQTINSDIIKFENYFNKLTKNVNYIKDNALERDHEDTIEQIDLALAKGEDIKNLIIAIKEKTRHFRNDFENQSSREMEEISQEQGQVMEIMNNQEALQNRRKELEQIHHTAALLKETTDKMATDVNKQGAMLEEIEANVINAKDNAVKAKQEITKADEISRGNRKRLLCLIIIILVALGGITAIILSLI